MGRLGKTLKLNLCANDAVKRAHATCSDAVKRAGRTTTSSFPAPSFPSPRGQAAHDLMGPKPLPRGQAAQDYTLGRPPARSLVKKTHRPVAQPLAWPCGTSGCKPYTPIVALPAETTRPRWWRCTSRQTHSRPGGRGSRRSALYVPVSTGCPRPRPPETTQASSQPQVDRCSCRSRSRRVCKLRTRRQRVCSRQNLLRPRPP